MSYTEENDITIFNSSKKDDADFDVMSSLEDMAHHRQNGNVDKAKELGVELALSIYDDDQPAKLNDPVLLSPEYFTQLCTLMLFSAEAALNYYLPSPQLSAIAINSFHEVMSRNNLPIYDEIMAGQAYTFSFYFLSVRKGGDNTDEEVGKVFAMLCKKSDDTFFISEGSRLYRMALDSIRQKIAEMQFED